MNSTPHLSRRPYGWLIAIGIALFLPRILTVAAQPDDIGHHIIWLRHFAQAFWQGDLYPRWLMDMQGGHGSPTFLYYPPLVYWIGSLIAPLTQPLHPEGWITAFAMMALGLGLSGAACFHWLRSRPGMMPGAAFGGALVYMLLPYHLGVDVYLRFGLAELWAFVWLPLLALGAERAAASTRFCGPLLAVAAAGLTLTHLPTAMIALPVPVLYAAALAPHRRLKTAAGALGAVVLGIGLAAFYLLPALAHLDWVHMEIMGHGHADYRRNFLFGEPGAVGAYVTLASCVTVLAGVAAFAISRGHAPAGERRLWLAVLLAAFALMCAPARPVWEQIPLLQRIQFPWRLNTVACLALIALWARMPLDPARRRLYTAVFLIISAMPLALAVAAGKARPFDRLASEENRLQLRYGIQPTDEHVPATAPLGYRHSAAFMANAARSDRLRWVEGEGAATVTGWDRRGIRLRIDTAGGGVLEITHFYFPRWHAADGAGAPLPLSPAPETGLMRLTVGPGAHEAVLTRKPTGWQIAGALVSAAACIILALGLRVERRSGKEA